MKTSKEFNERMEVETNLSDIDNRQFETFLNDNFDPNSEYEYLSKLLIDRAEKIRELNKDRWLKGMELSVIDSKLKTITNEISAALSTCENLNKEYNLNKPAIDFNKIVEDNS